MTRTPLRFLNALLWPVAIWGSLTHLEEHPADDYVERTSPIVAVAVGFWIGVAAWIGLQLSRNGRLFSISAGGEDHAMRVTNIGFSSLSDVLLFFLPLVYVIGFWLFTARDERFPR